MSQKKDKGKIILFNDSVFSVARLIFNYPNKSFHIRMLQRETGLSTTAVKDSIDKLESFEIIKVEKTSITTNIKANLDSKSYIFYKLIFNLYRFEHYEFLDILKGIYKNPEAIILFGSFARGEDIEESDIDILVITSNKSDSAIDDWTTDLENEMNRKVNIQVIQSFERSSNEFRNAIANGIVIHGYLKVI